MTDDPAPVVPTPDSDHCCGEWCCGPEECNHPEHCEHVLVNELREEGTSLAHWLVCVECDYEERPINSAVTST